ncbi:MAG TPA: tetratricopeptide repeat protein [Acetobacteraceae bacterium]|jgi:tetratricopeptide (TPR) repeat protein
MLSAFVPEFIRSWQERRQALREMQNMQQLDESLLELQDDNPVNLAKIAIQLGDKPAAAEHWENARSRYPGFIRKSHESLGILLALGRFDEAEALMLEGRKRAPGDPYYAGGFAQVAESRRDFPEAIRRWEQVRKRHRGYWRSYAHGAICLREAGRMDDAQALADKSVSVFPDQLECWLERARTAERRQDWPAAVRMWDEFGTRFHHVASDTGVAEALKRMGRIDEAEQRLKQALMSNPLVVEIRVALAKLAYERGDKQEALRLWEELRNRFPLQPFGYIEQTRLLIEMEQYDAAELVAHASIDRFPAEIWPLIDHGMLASSRKDWPEAFKRWDAVRIAFPDRAEGYLHAADALLAMDRKEEAGELRAAFARRSAG